MSYSAKDICQSGKIGIGIRAKYKDGVARSGFTV